MHLELPLPAKEDSYYKTIWCYIKEGSKMKIYHIGLGN